MNHSVKASMRDPFVFDEPLTWTVAGIGDALSTGSTTATAIVADCQRRVDASELNAIVSVDWERVRQAAEQTDRVIADGGPVGPFAGVPFTVKDVIVTAGLRATAGSRALLDNVPDTDATAVARLRSGDGLLIGKTNCPEFAITPGGCISPAFGETRNPIDLDRTPGSSSGGEAASIAAGLSVVGLGTDLGGSIRGPAAAVGIVSLRPTPGRIPSSGQFPGVNGQIGQGSMPLLSPATLQGRWQTVSPIARTIEDLHAVLAISSGPDGIDQGAAPVPVLDYRDVDTRSLSVGWISGRELAPVSTQVAAAMSAVADQLRPLCRVVASLEATFRPRYELFNELRSVDPLVDHVLAVGDDIEALSPALRDIITRSYDTDPLRLTVAWGKALAEQARTLEIFRSVDVVILPVNGADAVLRDGTALADGQVATDPLITMAPLRAISIMGAPAVAVPVSTTSAGAPISVQVVAAPWCEHHALAVAAALHAAYVGASYVGATR